VRERRVGQLFGERLAEAGAAQRPLDARAAARERGQLTPARAGAFCRRRA
jgi:hypothetical protein